MKDKINLLNENIKDYIPNIDLGQSYDQRYIDTDIHYERLEKLANFFGRKNGTSAPNFWEIFAISLSSVETTT